MKKILTFVLLFVCILSNVLCVQAADDTEVYYADSGTILFSYNLYEPPILYDQYINFHNTQKVSVYIEDIKQVFMITPEPSTFHSVALKNGDDPAKQMMVKAQTINSPIYTYNGVNYQFPFNIAYSIIQVGSKQIVSQAFDKIYATMNDFCDDLQKYDDLKSFVDKNDPSSSGGGDRLPLLSFQIKQAWTVADIGGTVKYTFNWKVGEHDIYASNPNKYKIQMLATAKYREETTSGTSTVIADELTYIYPECNFYISNAIPIYKESYSFLEREARNKLCDIAGVNKNNSSEVSSFFYLFVRVIEPESGKTSLWKVYKCQGRNITQSGYYYDDDGKQYTGNTDDDIDDSASYDNDPSTDANEDSNSPFYNDGAEIDAQHLLNNLEEIVSTLKGIPELFQKVFLWMPDYLIVLIATSIGLIIVIGFVKMFIR